MELKDLVQILRVVTGIGEENLFLTLTDTKKQAVHVLNYEIIKTTGDQYLVADMEKTKQEFSTDWTGVVQYFKGISDACEDFFASSKGEESGSGNHPLYEAAYINTLLGLCVPDDDFDDDKKKFPDYLQN